MQVLFPINIIELIFKGILIGIIASAPMGPVGVLCIQRVLNKGRWQGFATGVGAAFSDIIYALLPGLRMRYMLDFITKPTPLFILKVVGSLLLMAFGVYCFRSRPREVHLVNKANMSLGYNAHTAFWITFANPLIILLFIAVMAQLSFVVPNHPLEMGIGYLSIFVGALLWWFGLTWLVDQIKERFNQNGILIINKVIGAIVIIVSAIFLVGTVFNIYSLSWY